MAVPARTAPFPPEAAPLWERPLAPHYGYLSSVTTIDGVFVDRRDVIDLATGATLWELPWEPSDRDVLDVPFQNFLAGCGAFGEDLVVLAPRPDKDFKATGCDPRTGQSRWHTPRTRIDPFLWSDHAGKEPYLAAGGGIDMIDSECWAGIDPRGDRIRWNTPLDTPVTATAPDITPADTLVGIADDAWLSSRIAGLDSRTGQVRWRADDPGWALLGVGSSHVVTMRLWDTYGQPLCPGHFVEVGDANSFHARKPSACGACQAYVAVRVLDRATGRIRWQHTWQSASGGVDWSIGLDFTSSATQGTAAVCGDVLVTGEGEHLHGYRLNDGTPLWTSPLSEVIRLDIGRTNLIFPHLGTHQRWLPIDVGAGPTTTSLLVHAETGRIVTMDRQVWTVIDHTALTRNTTHMHAFALPVL